MGRARRGLRGSHKRSALLRSEVGRVGGAARARSSFNGRKKKKKRPARTTTHLNAGGDAEVERLALRRLFLIFADFQNGRPAGRLEAKYNQALLPLAAQHGQRSVLVEAARESGTGKRVGSGIVSPVPAATRRQRCTCLAAELGGRGCGGGGRARRQTEGVAVDGDAVSARGPQAAERGHEERLCVEAAALLQLLDEGGLTGRDGGGGGRLRWTWVGLCWGTEKTAQGSRIKQAGRLTADLSRPARMSSS